MATYLSPEQVNDLIDQLSDTDFDFLSDLCLNTVFDSLESVSFPTAKAKQTVTTHLNTTRFDLQVALAPKLDDLWRDVDNDGLEGLMDSDEQDDTSATFAQIQADLQSVTTAGAHAGDCLTVASVLITLRAPFEHLGETSVCTLNLMWLPEQELHGTAIN